MSRRIQSIRWFGGKGRMLAKLLPLLPECHTYVEPFGGAAWVLLNRAPSPVEVYNDINGELVNLFKVLADPEAFERFHRRVALLPYSRTLWREYRETYQEQTEPVERAVRFFVTIRQGFSGQGGAWSFSVTASNRCMASHVSSWLSCIEGLAQLHQRLQRVQIEYADWRCILDTYDTPVTLFYCDPPYVPGTRRSGGYKHELTTEEHTELVERLLGVRGMVALSGYLNDIYRPLEDAGWERTKWETACDAVGRTRDTGVRGLGVALAKQPRVECLWRNPACLAAFDGPLFCKQRTERTQKAYNRTQKGDKSK